MWPFVTGVICYSRSLIMSQTKSNSVGISNKCVNETREKPEQTGYNNVPRTMIPFNLCTHSWQEKQERKEKETQ